MDACMYCRSIGNGHNMCLVRTHRGHPHARGIYIRKRRLRGALRRYKYLISMIAIFPDKHDVDNIDFTLINNIPMVLGDTYLTV